MSHRLVLVLAVAACHHAAVHKPGDEYLAGVKFEGNHAFHDKALLTGLELHRSEASGRAPDGYMVQVDAERIRGQYLRAGYLDVDVRPRIERAGVAETVIFTIEEGVPATTRIAIDGIPDDAAVKQAAILAVLPIANGAPFDYAKFDLARDKLLGVVQDAGYAHARLDAEIVADRANRQAIVELHYDLGEPCKFGATQITGVDGEMKTAVEDRLHFATGDTYSNKALANTKQALYRMGRFSTVQVEPDKTTGDVVAVHVAADESTRHEVTFGGGFGVDPLSYEVRGRAGYVIAGWPVPLDTLTLDFRPAYAYLRDGTGYEPRMRALAKLERQDLFWTEAKGAVEVGYSYYAIEAYTLYGPRARLGFSTPLWTQRVQLRVGWQIQSIDFRDINPLIDTALQMQLGLDRTERDGTFDQAVIADFRNNPIEPRYGVYAALKVIEGSPYAGGNFTYVDVIPELRGYVPIGPIVIAARAKYGAIDGQVPVTERFFGGGAEGQRGFAERQLSPSVTGPYMGSTITIPYGGAGMIETGLEARIPITTIRAMPLGGVVFLDGGDVTEAPSQLNVGNLNWAVGVGARLHTVIGPVRFDLGYRVNRTGPSDPEPGSKMAFHLSVGEAF